ncbi:MAG: cytochrome P450 [Actinomycetota bacterium]|nr:cytochrome P450 [Actinomycetota bacterium]
MTDTQQPIPTVEFDIRSDAALWADPWGHWDVMRDKGRFLVNHTGVVAPTWIPTQYDDIYEAFRNPTLFSSRAVTPWEEQEAHEWIPVELDGMKHTKYRQLLMPFFTPAKADELAPMVREWCSELIERFADKGKCDFIGDFGRLYPTYIFMGLMGLPVEKADMFLDWADQLMHTPATEDPEGTIRAEAGMAIYGYLGGLIAERKANPQGDILTYLINAEIDGQPMPDSELLEYAFLLYMGGLDTVAGTLGCIFRHLADNPADRQRLVDDPSLIPSAIEEFLRYYSIVTTSRLVTEDTDFHGCPMHKGDRIQLSIASANRDPREFPDADKVIIDREVNRHIAFGAGPHRCLGSYLARAELKIAVEEWLARIPNYRVADPSTISQHAGGVAGYGRLDLVW